MLDSGWNVDEGAGWAAMLGSLEKDDVLTVEHVERLTGVVVNVPGRPEASRFVRFQDGEGAPVAAVSAFTVMVNGPIARLRPSSGPSTNPGIVSPSTQR